MHWVGKNRRRYKQAVLILFMIVPTATCSFSQDRSSIKFGRISPSDFNLSAYGIVDSNTNAAVIADIGSTGFIGNMQGWFSYVFKRHTRIKIINKKGFDLSTIKILMHYPGIDKFDNFYASTYNLENGKVAETKLANADLFEEKIDKNHIAKKFSMPAVKEGSIIEYTYTISSIRFDYLRDWEFQYLDYPCLWSEYQVTIPGLLSYAFLRQGYHSFSVDKTSHGSESYSIGIPADQSELGIETKHYVLNSLTTQQLWIMKNIPSFQYENYLSTPRNYIDKIEFQLSQTSGGNGEAMKNYTNTWQKATEELLKDDQFGVPLKENNSWLTGELNRVVSKGNGELQEAKDIYYYLTSNFTCTSYYNKYVTTSLKNIFKRRSGNVGELNLLLVAMLRQKDFPAEPVLLSTREFGINYPFYPLIDKFNYVVCKVRIGGVTYYLDATHPMLAFGKLAANCYNGHARVISNTDSGSVYFYNDELKEQKITSVSVSTSQKSGVIWEGNYESIPGYLKSFDIRNNLKNKGESDFYKSMQPIGFSDFQVENVQVDSLKMVEYPVKIHYGFKILGEANADVLYFNPVMWDGYKENEFKATERKYPVEMPYPVYEIYTLNLEIPEGYVVEELPKPARLTLNDNQGVFEYLVQHDDSNVQLRSSIKLNKANFVANEYNSLREFFAFVVKKQSEQLVFKKKK